MSTLSIKAFDLVYKRLGPTGSTGTTYIGYLPQFWWTASSASPPVSAAFLNFPPDTAATSTRQSSSNATYRALPWGSCATDFLWNVATPSWSFSDSTVSYSGATYVMRNWSLSSTHTGSFFKTYWSGYSSVGVTAYPVTTSWYITDPKFGNAANMYYVHSRNGLSTYPTYVGSWYAYVGTEYSSTVAYDITWPNVTSSRATSSIDGQYFDLGGGAAITRAAVSKSFVTQSISGSGTGTVNIRHYTEALKSRRLFFPIPVSGSGTTGGTDYFFKLISGYGASEIFSDNGGIYNIQLSLKRKVSTDNYPDTGSFLSVFIHNVQSQAPTPTGRIAGASGWYPPDNNIVKIGHGYQGGPQMSFYDVQTGYQIERFNFNVIQYGYPAQLCLEASGSLTDSSFFGIIIDDLQICKIGVTTDPRFIKPTTIAQNTFNLGAMEAQQYEPPGEFS